jgi:hypothetical protein
VKGLRLLRPRIGHGIDGVVSKDVSSMSVRLSKDSMGDRATRHSANNTPTSMPVVDVVNEGVAKQPACLDDTQADFCASGYV